MRDLPRAPSARDRSAWSDHLGRDVPSERLREQLTAGSLPVEFSTVAAGARDRPALTIGMETLTHGELDRRAGRASAWLTARGVQPGDRVALVSGTSADLVVAYLGVLRTGATGVLVSPAGAPPEIRFVLEDSGAKLVLGDVARAATLRDAAPDGCLVADIAEPGGGPESLAAEPLDPSSAALLAYTSGTTGMPKAVALSHRNLLASIRAALWAWRWTPDDVLVHGLPLYHQHGLGGLHAALLTGAHTVVQVKFDAAGLFELVRRWRATVLFAVPAMYERLVDPELVAACDLRSLRLAVSGSAPLPPKLFSRVEGAFGLAPLERYGTTESGLDVSNLYDGPRAPGSVGVPLPGVEVAIADTDGFAVPDGSDGEIVLRGPQVFAGYVGGGDAFLPGGWFRTGDVGRIDASTGQLAITGRLKELIISGGLNVYPREVELALEHDERVERAVVVGVPSDRWGEEVVAFVVPARDAAVDGAAVIAGCRERLAPFKCPKHVYPIAELPTNHMGKITRAPLVERAVEAERVRTGLRLADERLAAGTPPARS